MKGNRTFRMATKRTIIAGVLILMAVLFIGGCGGDEEGDNSGDSGSGAPESIIGWKMVQYVDRNDGQPTTIGVGRTVTYSFIDEHTILGEGLDTVPTTSWSYTSSGSSATLNLNYEGGTEVHELTFTSETQGTYETNIKHIFGMTGWTAGRFTITRVPSAGRSVLVWPMEDACHDGHDMELRFFDRTNDLVWPGEGRVYVLRGDNTYRLACRSGARVCYGARARNSPDSSYWGVGIDDDEGCTGCCSTCPTGGELEVDGHRLTCS